MTAPPSADEVARVGSWRERREAAVSAARRILDDYAAGRLNRYEPGWRWYVPWVSFTGRVLAFRDHLIGGSR